MQEPDAPPRLTAYRLRPTGMRLVPSEPRRPWMDATPNGFANRCLPLLIANQNGWLLLNDVRVRCSWDGSAGRDAVTVSYDGDVQPANPALCHFGSGIVTWRLPYLFRTSPGWNLVVRGAPNNPRPDAAPLDAVIETDWSMSPFTINWQITSPHREVVVEQGEPLCLLFPQRRGELESVLTEVVDVEDAPDVHAAVNAWSADRARFLADLPVAGTAAHARRWQREYFQGRSADDVPGGHQTRLRLNRFEAGADA